MSLKERSHEPFNKFILRTPLFSLNYLEKFCKNEVSLDDILGNDLFKEAIYFASDDLFTENSKILNDPNRKLKDNFKAAILKYFIRMCSRCTPFGIFAGCSTGILASESRLERGLYESFRRVVRIDMNYLYAIISKISSDTEMQMNSKFISNSSVYLQGDNFRFTSFEVKNGKRNYHLNIAKKDEYLNSILIGARFATHFDELVNILLRKGIDKQESKEYIIQLIQKQLIYSEFEPSVMGVDIFTDFLEKIKSVYLDNSVYEQLSALWKGIEHINHSPLGSSIDDLDEIKQGIDLIAETNDNKGVTFQADLNVNLVNNFLSKDVADEVYAAIRVLTKFSPKKDDNLKNFAQEFFKRYENAEIPLNEALDVETGIPFGYSKYGETEELLRDLHLSYKANGQENQQAITLDITQRYLMDKYQKALKNGDTVVELLDEELKFFPENSDNLPKTFSSIIEVFSSPTVTEPASIYLKTAGGSSAAWLLGRFCHIDANIEDFVSEITRKEDELYDEAIIAEILHLPDIRSVNIIHRPSIRNFEIPYLSNSSGDPKRTIFIDDIYISSRNGNEIRLRSKSLNKIIIPRLTNAHNYFHKNSLPLYSFLCAVQSQHEVSSLAFRWNDYVNGQMFIPRVAYKNVILSLATWNITVKNLQELPANSDSDFFSAVSAFFKDIKLPQFVQFGRGDNKLVIDTLHEESVKLLLSNRKASIRLTEFLFSNTNSLVKKRDESFTNEIILGFYQKNNK